MHQKRPFLTRKGDAGFNWPTSPARKGDDGFRQPGHLADGARPRHPWVVAGPGRSTRQRAKPAISTPGPTGVEGAGGTGGPGCGARGRWRGLAGLRDDAPSEARGADGERAGRRPRAHQVARPHSRIRRCPEHPWVHTAARPHRGRAAQQVSEAHRRITTMSGSPRPLSWRTLEIPSLAAISFAVPSMRGSS